jgi:general secretion pathway protein D
VFVNDGDMLVLGGLIDDQMRDSEQRVPGLGRIPGLGWLFRARKSERVKTNLMVFIRPTILRNSEDARFQSAGKYRYLQDLQRQMNEERGRMLRSDPAPEMPPFPEAPATAPEAAPADGSQPQ